MKNRKTAVDAAPGFGVGVQVYVTEPQTESGEDWVGEPTGVIIAPGAASLRSVNLPAGDVTSWLVAFSEPQHRRDGRGPYEQATIAQALLVTADPIDG
ncbi:hypothetical protein GCM10027406_11310 [Leifsonia lichenia]